MNFLLINPNGRTGNYQSLMPLTAIEPPIWCGIIASYLRSRGFSVNILDANALELSATDTAKEAVGVRADLVVVVVYGHNPSASTQVMPEATRIVKKIKQLRETQKVILVGGHVAALPQQTLDETGADAVCEDEGLESLAGYFKVRTQLKSKPVVHAPLYDFADYKGMVWDLLPMEKYRAHTWQAFGYETRQPYASLYTTLGCPFSCDYCNIQVPFRKGEEISGMTKNSYRKIDPFLVVNEFKKLKDWYGVTHVKIADELFMWDYGHVEEICDNLINWKLDFNIWAYARVDRLDDRILEKMKRAGFNWLCLGIEAGNREVRKGVHKGYRTEKVFEAVEKIQSHGIHVIANYMFGLPDDTMETMRETLDMAIELNTEFANFYCVVPYPGSKLYERGVDLSKNWEAYAQLSSNFSPLGNKNLTGEEIVKFRDEAFNKYFKRTEYRFMLASKFGIDGLGDYIKMVQVGIDRGGRTNRDNTG